VLRSRSRPTQHSRPRPRPPAAGTALLAPGEATPMPASCKPFKVMAPTSFFLSGPRLDFSCETAPGLATLAAAPRMPRHWLLYSGENLRRRYVPDSMLPRPPWSPIPILRQCRAAVIAALSAAPSSRTWISLPPQTLNTGGHLLQNGNLAVWLNQPSTRRGGPVIDHDPTSQSLRVFYFPTNPGPRHRHSAGSKGSGQQ